MRPVLPAPPVAAAVQLEVGRKGWRLEPVTTEIHRGCTALLGTNGAGKTTFMRAFLGLEKARGEVWMGDPSVRPGSPEFRLQVGYMPQRPEFPRLVSVRQALGYAAALKGMKGTAVGAAIDRVVEAGDLGAVLDRPADRLSGGEKQRLALAQATIHRPSLVILDEPSAGLDPVQRTQFRAWLKAYCTEATALVSTHLVEDVAPIAERVLVLHAGRKVFDGPTQALVADEPVDADSVESALVRLVSGGLG